MALTYECNSEQKNETELKTSVFFAKPNQKWIVFANRTPLWHYTARQAPMAKQVLWWKHNATIVTFNTNTPDSMKRYYIYAKIL